MTKILIKLFTVLSQYGYTSNEDKENDRRIHFRKTINKATAEIVVDVIEDKNMLIVFYDLKDQKYVIIDSIESFDYAVIQHALCHPSISIPAPVIKETIPQKRGKSLLDYPFGLNE